MRNRSLLLVGMLLTGSLASVASAQIVLAIPPRHDLINLGFDLSAMLPRTLDLVCHGGPAGAVELERYHAAAGRWVAISLADWEGLRADRLVLVGTGPSASVLKTHAGWARQLTVVDGRRLHEVANAVSSYKRLNETQWNRLAETYGFQLLDRNIERRRFGRYGPRGGWSVQEESRLPALMQPEAVMTVPRSEIPAAMPEPATVEAETEETLVVPAVEAPEAAVGAVAGPAEAVAGVAADAGVAAEPVAIRPEDK